ncbi:methionine aminopeptidase, type I [Aeromonas sp. RU39B]|uniref:M24 family metallopeptidase n=1 Tax=Aeromonas sp. RU39B TaxID=1907416 RepID=UPI000955AA73|nr:M24 family metallopeptidase [Aeromonas sp. RU39B]SIQ43888.1 methionine aminopeptidase, type I [Aeromonas sp. RU39B]
MREIAIHDDNGLKHIRVAAGIASSVLDWLIPHVIEGVTTESLDLLCRQKIAANQAEPGYLGYRGFDKAIYTSVNDVVSRGRPDNRELRQGDVLNIDLAVVKDGWFGHTSRMFSIGEVDPVKEHLIDSAYTTLLVGISHIKPGVAFSTISHAIDDAVKRLECHLAVKCIGHGIGAAMSPAPPFIAKGWMTGNEVAVFTAMGMCWSGFLSTHTTMLDALGYRHLTSCAIVAHTVGGLCAGVAGHQLYMLLG